MWEGEQFRATDISKARVNEEEIMLIYKVLQMLRNMARSVVSL